MAVANWTDVTHTGLKLSGTLNANGQQITTPAGITFAAASLLSSTVDNSYIQIRGGVNAGSSIINLYGKDATGQIEFYTPRTDKADRLRMIMSGDVDVASCSWTNCKQVFDATSLPNGDPGVSGQLYYLAATGVVMRSA